ncbi:DUF6445 family protein [Steroidobacter agaridevorans]|uniref:DUF6445 family protein n=1 Tax=Steroidobacter agaridevorans TaxID=2695856 RepID=UPI00132B20C0|nr:DUF6445 family protein [Steroidobacter agaridevorans]GFE85979.1 hypothetical protein GCM10011488_09330 [Steroidobacter agaridevorans]
MSAVEASWPLLLGQSISVRLQHVGAERQPLMIVDDVLAEPQAMIDEARVANFYVPHHTNYPGINAPIPQSYYLTVIAALRGPIEAAFGLSRSAYISYFGFLALATIGAAEAQPVQKIPHRDSPDPNRLAMVHYLCRGNFGGTGFFRHRATGYESVDASRQAIYESAARRELAETSQAHRYVDARTSNYELIGHSEAVFNRLIVYRSHVLHTALLADSAGSPDPTVGRLTANGFIEAAK